MRIGATLKANSFGARKGVSTIVIAVVVIVIVVAAVGGYYLTTSPSSSKTNNLSSISSTAAITTSVIVTTLTTTSTTTSTSVKPIESVKIDIVSGAHVESQAIHFVPQTITVEMGINNTITWVNQDTTPHTVTSNTNTFNSGTISPGSNFTMTFTTPGTYQYHCSIHPFMTGTVIVLSATGQVVSQPSSSSTSNLTTSSTGQNAATTSCSYYYGGVCY